MKHPKGYWKVKENMMEEAKKYSTKEEFKKGNFKQIISEWRRLSSTTGNRVKVYKKGKALIADAVGITNMGALIVETDDGKLEKITSGECIIIDDE